MISDKGIKSILFLTSLGLAGNGNNFFDVHMRTSIHELDANNHFKSGASDQNDSLVC